MSLSTRTGVAYLFTLGVLATVALTGIVREPTFDRWWASLKVSFEEAGAATVVKYEPDETVPGGILTVRDFAGREREIVVSPDAAARTRVLAYPRDRFMPRERNLDFMMWYWDGTNPADGRLVIHRVS